MSRLNAEPPNVDSEAFAHGATTSKAPGHWVLARLGKRVLRPGGLDLTRRLLDALDIGTDDAVVEFAPGLGATARMTLRRKPAAYTAVERDECAAQQVRRFLSGPRQQCLVGKAEATGLPDGTASVVYGEAMLTMQSSEAKNRIVREAARLLRPGGRYGIHEIAFTPDSLDESVQAEVRRELTDAIRHAVHPLTQSGWRELLDSHGLVPRSPHIAPMHLLEPRRLLDDEGFLGALRFVFNVIRDGEARRRVLAMRDVFRRHQHQLCAISIVADMRNKQ